MRAHASEASEASAREKQLVGTRRRSERTRAKRARERRSLLARASEASAREGGRWCAARAHASEASAREKELVGAREKELVGTEEKNWGEREGACWRARWRHLLARPLASLVGALVGVACWRARWRRLWRAIFTFARSRGHGALTSGCRCACGVWGRACRRYSRGSRGRRGRRRRGTRCRGRAQQSP